MKDIFSKKNCACMEYFSQIKCIMHASFYHVMLNWFFFLPWPNSRGILVAVKDNIKTLTMKIYKHRGAGQGLWILVNNKSPKRKQKKTMHHKKIQWNSNQNKQSSKNRTP